MMRMLQTFVPSVVLLLPLFMLGCQPSTDAPTESAGAESKHQNEPTPLTEQERQNAQYTPEIMWKMGRLASPTLSPDSTKVLYSVTHTQMEENRQFTRIFVQGVQEEEPVLITSSGHSPAWHPTEDKVCFLAKDEKTHTMQLFAQAPDGKGTPTQLTHIEGGIDAYWLAPTGEHLLFAKKVQVEPTTQDQYPHLEKAHVRIIDSLMYRHWDYWVEGQYSHLFLTSREENGSFATQATDLMPDEPWDVPMAPYFSDNEVAWAPDGQTLFYTAKKLAGKAYATSTNSNIYAYSLQDQSTKQVNSPNPGYDQYPVPSPCGQYILWQRMKTPSYESDRAILMCQNLATGEEKELTADFDQNADDFHWGSDAHTIHLISAIQGTVQLFTLHTETGQIEPVTQGQWNINWARQLPNKEWLVLQTRLDRPAELYRFAQGQCTPFTHINDAIYSVIPPTPVKPRWITTTDQKQMLAWVVYPPHFDSTKKYPTILYCQGGPQSTVSQFYSFRWCIQLLASQGYVVVMPNRRGVPSFGQAWNQQISGDYSGQNIKDYLSAIDDVAKEPWCDNERLGAIGASYGGYSVFYLAGIHENRFKAFVAHNGMFNFESFYAATEETFFPNFDFGGAYWEHNNATAQRSYAHSPHRNVHKWNTPILIIVGENDFRIPYTEGLQAFNAAQLNGCPARLLVFPEETHFVSQPQNSLIWHHEMFAWLGKHLGVTPSQE